MTEPNIDPTTGRPITEPGNPPKDEPDAVERLAKTYELNDKERAEAEQNGWSEKTARTVYAARRVQLARDAGMTPERFDAYLRGTVRNINDWKALHADDERDAQGRYVKAGR